MCSAILARLWVDNKQHTDHWLFKTRHNKNIILTIHNSLPQKTRVKALTSRPCVNPNSVIESSQGAYVKGGGNDFQQTYMYIWWEKQKPLWAQGAVPYYTKKSPTVVQVKCKQIQAAHPERALRQETWPDGASCVINS